MLLGVGLWVCAGIAVADTPVAVDDPACPSQDFTRFLQRFADPADDRVRLRYTSDPLEYEVPMHTVRDDHEGLAPTHVVLEQGAARLKRFSYRYLAAFDLFVPSPASRDPAALEHMRAGTYNAPTRIEAIDGNGQRVTFGSDAERDTYTFARRYGCWMLTRASNLRD
ncbi:hypothetical protein CR920_00420 [Stenotrophomonas indicatrix]|nr:hypothetical protein CR920_00420 [Stenotrophomonas indicatrix]